MNPLELLIEWFRAKLTEKKRLVTCAKNAVPSGAWPSENENDVVFFTAIIETLKTVTRSNAVSVLQSWAREFPAHSGYLGELADQFDQQLGEGIDLDDALDVRPPPSRHQSTSHSADESAQLLTDKAGVRGTRNVPIGGGVQKSEPFRHPSSLFEGEVQRSCLFDPLLEFARRRDIVFALGGVGSGLNTFCGQFNEHLQKSAQTQILFEPDLQYRRYRNILTAREKIAEAIAPHTIHSDLVLKELKCLLASLAYATYVALRDQFPKEIDRLLPARYPDEILFAQYFFAGSDAMVNSNASDVVAHFLATVQKLAKATHVKPVIVLMPWEQLSKIFADRADATKKSLAKQLWDALGEIASAPCLSNRASHDSVCFIVAGPEVWYGHSEYLKRRVANTVWPIPPLNSQEVGKLLRGIRPELENDTICRVVLDWTGGSPWFVKLLLSYLLEYSTHAADTCDDESVDKLLSRSAEAAEASLECAGIGIPDPIGVLITSYTRAVRSALGDRQSTDGLIEDKWRGPKRTVENGYRIEPYRIEAFVASGLIWLDGTPWNPAAPDYVFRKYPLVYLRRAGRLPLALYRAISGRQYLRLAPY